MPRPSPLELEVFHAAYALAEMDCARQACTKQISRDQLFVGKFDFSLFGNGSGVVCPGDRLGKCKGVYCVDCFFEELRNGDLNEFANQLRGASDLKGYGSLAEKDQAKLRCAFNKCADAETCKGECPGSTAAGAQDAPQQQEKQEKQEQHEMQEQPKQEKQAPPPQQKQRDQASEEPHKGGKRKAQGGTGQSGDISSPTQKRQKDIEVGSDD